MRYSLSQISRAIESYFVPGHACKSVPPDLGRCDLYLDRLAETGNTAELYKNAIAAANALYISATGENRSRLRVQAERMLQERLGMEPPHGVSMTGGRESVEKALNEYYYVVFASELENATGRSGIKNAIPYFKRAMAIAIGAGILQPELVKEKLYGVLDEFFDASGQCPTGDENALREALNPTYALNNIKELADAVNAYSEIVPMDELHQKVFIGYFRLMQRINRCAESTMRMLLENSADLPGKAKES
ncbi:hypothetical protein HYU11_02285 [Candidatus Woesearchaeota archaeon]|nr:hypothetical protein [Candidatus Woesearchaeota archaeon]